MNTIKELIHKLNKCEKIVLYTLGIVKNLHILRLNKLHKILFLASEVLPELVELFSFDALYLGPFSIEINYSLSNLDKLELVMFDNGQYRLTEKGQNTYRKLELKKELKNLLHDLKEFLWDVPEFYIFVYICVTIPDFEEFSGNEITTYHRLQAAKYLFDQQKINFTQAVEIAKVSISNFEENTLEKDDLGIIRKYFKAADSG